MVLAHLLDAMLELEELARAGYVLERPVEADGLRLSRVVRAGALGETTPRPHQKAAFSDLYGRDGIGGMRDSATLRAIEDYTNKYHVRAAQALSCKSANPASLSRIGAQAPRPVQGCSRGTGGTRWVHAPVVRWRWRSERK